METAPPWTPPPSPPAPVVGTTSLSALPAATPSARTALRPDVEVAADVVVADVVAADVVEADVVENKLKVLQVL